MSDEIGRLGTEVANWSIKAFSVEMREQINRAARQADCTVAEFLHGHFVRFGIAGQQFDPVKLDQDYPPPSASSSAPVPAAAVATLVDAACRLAAAKGLRRHVRAAAEQAIVQSLDVWVIDPSLPPARRVRHIAAISAPPDDDAAA